MRAAIYARYSSENQREASIADQIEVCRRYAAQHGLEVVEIYDDKAISGSDRNRPGFQRLLSAARNRQFDVILVEALDRLTRRLSDVASTFDELQFLGLGLHAVNVGAVTTMHVGLLGTMAQMFLADLRDKTRRGQLGRVLKGRVAGGTAYGYEVLPGDETGHGARKVDPEEAKIVRRIFSLFAGGMSPRAIAKKLNAEGIKGPGGRPWQDTTIRGQKERGTGILNNELYIGRIAWNRCSYVKDPRSGKRLARINPESSREHVDVPDLRIVDEALWQRVKQRQSEIGFTLARDSGGNALNRAHRRKFLLSGLLTCGCCGAGYTIVGKDVYGCRRNRGMGNCGNDVRVSRFEVERRIMTALKEKLLAPDLIAEFTRAYQEEVNRLAATAGGRRTDRERQLKAIERKIQAIMEAVEKGLYSPSMNDRMRQLEVERQALQRVHEAVENPSPVMVHPNLAELYRRRVGELEQLLVDPELGSEAMDLIRSMITEITVMPRDGAEGVDLELAGDLARILHLCSTTTIKQNAQAVAGSGRVGAFAYELSVVAGIGIGRDRHSLAVPI
jgi:DNA invertase Pin-like site-specific DNA recombinase